MAGLADLRMVGKPSTFSGDEDLWNEWSFQVKAYSVMAGIITATAMASMISGRVAPARSAS